VGAPAFQLYDATTLPLVAGRTPLLPVEKITAIFESENCLAALHALLEQEPEVRHAIYVASPSLSDAVDRWLAGAPMKNPRAPLRALAYVARMAFRCTPFGLCAGVGLIEVERGKTTLRLDPADRRTRTRPDMGLLLNAGRSLEKSEAGGHVQYIANRAVLSRGDRLYVTNVELVRTAHAQTEGATEQRPVSLRNTAAVQYVRELTGEPRSLASIVRSLTNRFNASSDDAEHVVRQLIEAGLLISELRASPIGDPVSYMLQCFERIDPEIAATLRRGSSLSAALDRKPLHERDIGDYRRVHEAFSELGGERKEHVMQIDLHAPLAGGLNSDILNDVALLAEYSIRMAPVVALSKFRKRFEERYEGSDRIVPLLELVDPNLGLGVPEDFERRDVPNAEHESALAKIACDALKTGAEEVGLSGKDLQLLIPPLVDTSYIESVEMGFHVVASSRAAIDVGDYLVVPATFAGSDRAARSLGRFVNLLGEESLERVHRVCDAEPHDGHLRAELVFTPAESRFYNVVIRPKTIDVEIRLGVGIPRTEDEIPPDDLWVGVEDGKFYLWSACRQRRVAPVESHLFVTDRFAPNVCRFLAIIANDGKRLMRGFDWGALSSLTYLPRVRVGRVVLSHRRWLFRSQDALQSLSDATVELARLRSQWNLPRYVLLADADNRLLVDLDSKIAPELLFDQTVRARRPLHLIEALPSPEHAWLQGSDGHYSVEFAASVLQSTSDRAALRDQSGALPPGQMADGSIRKRYGFGSRWAYLKLYIADQASEYFLLKTVMPLIRELQDQEAIDRWFFVRYADPQFHLRLRVRAVDGSTSTVCDKLVAGAYRWLAEDLVLRYAFDTYDPEYERYGGPAGVELAEEFFTLDSNLCIDLISRIAETTEERVAAAVESFVPWLTLDAASKAALITFGKTKQQSLPPADRKSLKHLSSMEVSPNRHGIMEAILAQHRPELTIASLFHMHCNRLGLSHDGEARANSLMRHLLLSRAARATNEKAVNV